MLLGSIVHNLILQPKTFDDKYVVEPEFNKRTNQGKEDYQKFLELVSARNLQSVPQNIFIKAKELVTQFINSQNYKYIVDTSVREERFDKDYSGLPICGYIDAMSSEYNIELKTVSSADYNDIQRDFYNLKYHLQAAIYNWANDKKVMYVVIETSYPYLSKVFVASDEYIEYGRSLFNKATSDFSFCLDMGLFESGYEFYGGAEPQVLDLPGWAKKGVSDE
jgi:exodeoxyribonuclease VIII